jgi:hypothetical protein
MDSANPYRPLLSEVRDGVAHWKEPDLANSTDDTLVLVDRSERAILWACGNCKREGRSYESELPPACPRCGQGWKP